MVGRTRGPVGFVGGLCGRWRLFCLALGTLVLAYASIASAGSEPVTLVWSFWGDPGELPPNWEVIGAFEATHPGVRIKVQHAPWSSYFDKIQTQMAGGTAPDVMFLNNIPSYAARGVLEPLDDFIAQSGFDTSPYYPELLRIFMYDGKVYGLPRDNDTTVLYYNKKLFTEAGVAYPDRTWNWNTLVEAGKKLTRADPRGRITQYAIALERNKYPLFVYQNGGAVFDDALQPTRFMLHEPPAAEAIQYMADLMIRHRIAPSFVDMQQMGSTTELFLTGRVAMVMTNAARIPSFVEAGFEWDVAPLPTGPTGIRANSLGGAGYVISATSKHKREAWEFLKFLAGPEGQRIFAKTGVAVPAYRSPETRAAFLEGPPPSKQVFLEETEHGKLFPYFSGWVEISRTIVDPALDLVFIGERKASAALQEIAPAVQAKLNELRGARR